MQTIYKLRADELNNDFLDALKTLFKNKEIEIIINESNPNEEDETAYLLQNTANRSHLLNAIENIAQKKQLVSFDMDNVE